ncbi:MAG: enolase C-terminal domain-like protein [Solirubrobacterales bacterium]
MDRRSFLKAAGIVAALAGRAAAKHLVLLNVPETITISRIDWFLYETGLRGPADEPDRRCAVRITAEPGIQGWADSSNWIMPNVEIARAITNRLAGREISGPAVVWRELYEAGLPLGALGAVDVALWDLLGRMQDKPVHALLGTQRQKVRAYVTTDFNLGNPSQYADYALSCRQMGVHGCKIRPNFAPGAGAEGAPGIGFPDRDMAVYQAVREAVGPDFACMADNGGTYTFDEALRVGRLLDNLQYAWYESPMPETEICRERYIALAAQLKTPICAPESLAESYPARITWLTSKACDIANINVHLGGLTPCFELAAACEAAGARLELTDIGLDSYPHLQMIAATSESLIKYVELSSLPRTEQIHPGRTTPEPLLDEEGCIAIPQTPGMGIELDWQHIITHRVG